MLSLSYTPLAPWDLSSSSRLLQAAERIRYWLSCLSVAAENWGQAESGHTLACRVCSVPPTRPGTSLSSHTLRATWMLRYQQDIAALLNQQGHAYEMWKHMMLQVKNSSHPAYFTDEGTYIQCMMESPHMVKSVTPVPASGRISPACIAIVAAWRCSGWQGNCK